MGELVLELLGTLLASYPVVGAKAMNEAALAPPRDAPHDYDDRDEGGECDDNLPKPGAMQKRPHQPQPDQEGEQRDDRRGCRPKQDNRRLSRAIKCIPDR